MRLEILKNGERVAILSGQMIQKIVSGSIEETNAVYSSDKDATMFSISRRLPDIDFDDVREIDEAVEAERIEAERIEAENTLPTTDQAERVITAYAKTVRDQFTTIDATQAEAYRQAEIVARRVIAGDASTADKAFLKARDVDAKTTNPMTGKPVKDVAEAAKVIVMTAEIWYSVLNTTEVARKQAVAQIRAMEPKDIPRDLNKWLTENFKWLPDNLS